MDKAKLIQKTQSEINKKMGDGTLIRLGDTGVQPVDRITTGILSLDKSLGGGGPRGRIIEIYGPEAGGKTSIALQILGQAQKQGGVGAFVDLEYALDPMLASNCYGVDIDNLLYGTPTTGEEAFEMVEGLSMSGVDVIIMDSVSALLPSAEMDNEMGKPGMAVQARLISQCLRRLVGVLSKHNTLLIMVNQLRTNLAAYGAPADTPGGRAIKHYASVRLEVRRSTFLDNAFKEQKTKENAFGHVVTCFTAKNKTAIPFKKTEFNLIYGVGFDTLSDTINLAVDFNIVDKSGAWYTYNEQRYQGLANFNDMLRNNAEVYGEIQSKVFDMIKG